MEATTTPLQFRDARGRLVGSAVEWIQHWLEEHPNGKIYVGSDSKKRGDLVKYAVAICLWDVGHGVHELWHSHRVQAPRDAYGRLWHEVELAVQAAETIREVGPLTVHLDFNSNPRYRSHALYDAGMGYLQALGFEAAGKPWSWAASCGAHRHCQ